MCIFWYQQIGQVTKSYKSEGTVTNPVFFLENEMVNLYFNFYIFNSLGWFFAAIYELLVGIVVKSTVTKYAIKNFI